MTEAVDHNQEISTNTIFGFWVYLMTDFILFAALFATYAVLHDRTFGGPTAQQILSIPYSMAETLVLLTSSFTCSLALMAATREKKVPMSVWFGATFLLGVAFLAMVGTELGSLIHDGITWRRSGFLSSYFTLVATHAVHIIFGLLFMIVLVVQGLRRGLIPIVTRRLTCLSMFWFFSYVVWIFMYTIVYLIGAS